MKNILLIVSALLGIGVQAQFKISGQIKGYNNEPIHIKLVEDGESRLVKRVITGNDGNFEYEIKNKYYGIVNFQLVKGSFDVVAINQDIKFTTSLNDSNHIVNYEENSVNAKLNLYEKIQNLQSLRDNTLMPLLAIYNSDEKFYSDLVNEISRINELQNPKFENEYIKYYISTKEKLSEIAALNDRDKADFVAKSHLVNDDENLEQFGFLNPFINIYISNSLGAAKSREEAVERIQKAIDTLLNEAVVETPRGQHILATLITMLDGNGFKELAEKYVSQANEMKCTITGELKNILKAQNSIKVGKTAPNIILSGNKAKSLYDIKAEQKLIIFWASWCPHCVKEMPHVVEFYKDFKKQGGEIIAISLDMDKDEFEKATQNHEWINYTDYLKWDSPIVSEYGVKGTPTFFLVDKNNKIIKIGSRVSEFMPEL